MRAALGMSLRWLCVSSGVATNRAVEGNSNADYFFFGASTITIWRPSSLGMCSTTATSASSSRMRSSHRMPMSWRGILGPRKRNVHCALAAAEAQRHFALVAVLCNEAAQVAHLDVVVALVGAGAELHFLDLDDLLLALGLGCLFLFLVLELAVVHQPTYRRIRRGRDLDQV